MRTILVVEDEALLRKAVTISLREAGYDVRLAENGEQALAAIGETPPDLVLLDLVMPRLDGFALLSALQAEPADRRAPVIVMSNLNQPEDVEKARALGAVGYLVKSNVRLETLVERVRAFFADPDSAAGTSAPGRDG